MEIKEHLAILPSPCRSAHRAERRQRHIAHGFAVHFEEPQLRSCVSDVVDNNSAAVKAEVLDGCIRFGNDFGPRLANWILQIHRVDVPAWRFPVRRHIEPAAFNVAEEKRIQIVHNGFHGLAAFQVLQINFCSRDPGSVNDVNHEIVAVFRNLCRDDFVRSETFAENFRVRLRIRAHHMMKHTWAIWRHACVIRAMIIRLDRKAEVIGVRQFVWQRCRRLHV